MRYLADVVTLEFDPELCHGCGMCRIVCPQNVFGPGKGTAVIADRDACMECGACAMNCEPGALTVRSGVGCAAGIIAGALGGSGDCCCGGDDDTCGPSCC